jgi:hypothetical protein
LATFRQKVEAAIPALRRYARALTRDADIADDLVQDTLMSHRKCDLGILRWLNSAKVVLGRILIKFAERNVRFSNRPVWVKRF